MPARQLLWGPIAMRLTVRNIIIALIILVAIVSVVAATWKGVSKEGYAGGAVGCACPAALDLPARPAVELPASMRVAYTDPDCDVARPLGAPAVACPCIAGQAAPSPAPLAAVAEATRLAREVAQACHALALARPGATALELRADPEFRTAAAAAARAGTTLVLDAGGEVLVAPPRLRELEGRHIVELVDARAFPLFDALKAGMASAGLCGLGWKGHTSVVAYEAQPIFRTRDRRNLYVLALSQL